MLEEIVLKRYGRTISQCREEELYHALFTLVQEKAQEKEIRGRKKKLYYISAEFLMGKLLSNNLINLGIYEEIKDRPRYIVAERCEGQGHDGQAEKDI